VRNDGAMLIVYEAALQLPSHIAENHANLISGRLE